ncbi:DUF4383 domain-containing protein [Streptomyces sp. NPDC048197]|uniref:DUF4383 domain-containing protein n=1 Tax=Streptomyces sp. NPDC048197 TaxID=3365511 RepID=UPI00371102B4
MPGAPDRAATLVGALFLVVGVLGFVPGVTTHYDQMSFADPHGAGSLFGLFAVSMLHNLVHVVFGLLGLAVGRRAPRYAKPYLVGGGLVYLALWVYGLAIHRATPWNFLTLNGPDNWLHLLLGFGMVALGVLLAPRNKPGR